MLSTIDNHESHVGGWYPNGSTMVINSVVLSLKKNIIPVLASKMQIVVAEGRARGPRWLEVIIY